jgi:hypothetical protein
MDSKGDDQKRLRAIAIQWYRKDALIHLAARSTVQSTPAEWVEERGVELKRCRMVMSIKCDTAVTLTAHLQQGEVV